MSLENTSVYGEFISFSRLKRTLTIVFSYYLTYDNVNRVYDMCFRALYMLWAVFIYICISPYLFARSNKCLKFNFTNSKKNKTKQIKFFLRSFSSRSWPCVDTSGGCVPPHGTVHSDVLYFLPL